MNSHACIIWFSVLTVITSITSCLCPMYQTITIYTIASNIVLTEMIGRHAVVIVRHFMLFLNNICIIHNIYTFSKNDQLKSIYLKPLYRMMILLKLCTVRPLQSLWCLCSKRDAMFSIGNHNSSKFNGTQYSLRGNSNT